MHGGNTPERWLCLLAAVWLGGMLALAVIAAPALVGMLDRPMAGAVAGRMFQWEAHGSLVLAAVMFVGVRRRSRERALAGQGSVMSWEVLVVLGVLFCTVLGYHAIQPWMVQAKAGQPTPLSFAALHRMSTAFFVLKALLLAVLAVGACRPSPPPPSAG